METIYPYTPYVRYKSPFNVCYHKKPIELKIIWNWNSLSLISVLHLYISPAICIYLDCLVKFYSCSHIACILLMVNSFPFQRFDQIEPSTRSNDMQNNFRLITQWIWSTSNLDERNTISVVVSMILWTINKWLFLSPILYGIKFRNLVLKLIRRIFQNNFYSKISNFFTILLSHTFVADDFTSYREIYKTLEISNVTFKSLLPQYKNLLIISVTLRCQILLYMTIIVNIFTKQPRSHNLLSNITYV